jgi:hypothetical protein
MSANTGEQTADERKPKNRGIGRDELALIRVSMRGVVSILSTPDEQELVPTGHQRPT